MILGLYTGRDNDKNLRYLNLAGTLAISLNISRYKGQTQAEPWLLFGPCHWPQGWISADNQYIELKAAWISAEIGVIIMNMHDPRPISWLRQWLKPGLFGRYIGNKPKYQPIQGPNSGWILDAIWPMSLATGLNISRFKAQSSLNLRRDRGYNYERARS